MLSRQRVSLLSASHAAPRVCIEAAALAHGHGGPAHHVTPYRYVYRPGLKAFSSTGAMHTTPPPASSATSPTAGCQWRRGRPVTSGSSAFNPLSDSGTCAQPSTAPAPGANIRPGLWNPTLPLRFASGAAAETHPTEHEELGSGYGHLSDHDVQGAINHIDAGPPTTHNGKQKQDDEMNTEIDPETDSKDQDSPALGTSAISEHADALEDVSASATPTESGDETPTQESEEDIPEQLEPLSYQIPEDKLSAAMHAAPKTRASYWSTKLYQGPEGEALNIHYCKSKDVAERVAKKFLNEKVVGFDIEWKLFGLQSSIKQNASLIQLACEDRIALFHISLFEGATAEELMPPSLKVVLESPEIYKVGVAIKGDFKRLTKYLGIQAQGVFELSRLHNLVQWHEVDPKRVNNKLVSLTAQVHQHLQLPLYKGEPLDDDPATTSSVRESDWSLPLDLSQIHYAAADAYAGFRLYDALERKRAQLKPTPSAILVCDYDNAPKPKAPRKTKKTAVSKDASDGAVTSTADAAEVEQDDEKESDDYETASEDFMNNRETKESNVSISSPLCDVTGSSHVSGARRVGRIKLPTLRGPDPAYPILPRDHTPDSDNALLLSESEDQNLSEGDSTSDVDKMNIFKSTLMEELESENEFADVELEEALQGLTLDSNGRLQESEAKVSNSLHAQGYGSPQMASLATDALGFNPIEHEDDKLLPATARLTECVSSPGKAQIDSAPGQAGVQSSSHPHPQTPLPKQATETPEYVLATDWARDYLQGTIPSPTATTPSRIRATIPHLRAYHMWHHQELAVEKIAEHLREPPLSLSTVQGYILQAITMEKLDYNKDLLKDVVVAMPISQRKGRWRWLAEKIGAF